MEKEFNNIVDISSFCNEGDESSVLICGKEINHHPKFSIIIPTYKRTKLLERALKSAKEQNFDDYEIIVVDNDPQDNEEVKNIVTSFDCDKLRYYKNKKNLGAEGNFNRGIQLAQGTYVTLLHDDDFLSSEFLTTVNKYIDGNKAIMTYYSTGGVGKTNNKKSFLKMVAKGFLQFIFYLNPWKSRVSIWDLFLESVPVGTIGVVYSRSALMEIGGFNKNAYPGTDYELNMRYIYKFKGKLIPYELMTYWIEDNDSLTINRIFPKFNFRLRKHMLENSYIENTKRNRRLLTDMFYFDYNAVKSMWGVEPEIPEKMEHRSLFSQKRLKLWLIIRNKVKYGNRIKNAG